MLNLTSNLSCLPLLILKILIEILLELELELELINLLDLVLL